MIGALRRRRTPAQEAALERDATRPQGLDPKDIKVRPLEERDCFRVKNMVYDFMFIANAKGISLDIVQGKLFLAFVAVLALFCYLTYETNVTMVAANLLFFSSIVLAYWYVTYRVCRGQFFQGEDTVSTEEQFYAYWSDNAAGRYMWVAEVEGKVVGAAGVVNTSPTSACLRRIVVSPDFQQRGVGSELMLRLLDSCVFRKVEEVEVTISYRQLPAQKMFKKFGFRTNSEGFTNFGTRPFFTVRSAKYVLSLEKIE